MGWAERFTDWICDIEGEQSERRKQARRTTWHGLELWARGNEESDRGDHSSAFFFWRESARLNEEAGRLFDEEHGLRRGEQ